MHPTGGPGRAARGASLCVGIVGASNPLREEARSILPLPEMPDMLRPASKFLTKQDTQRTGGFAPTATIATLDIDGPAARQQ